MPSSGADDEREEMDATAQALHSAAASGDEAAVRLALQSAAAHVQEEEHGRSALMLAAEGGHEAVVSLLLSSGARTSVPHKPDVAIPRSPGG